MTFGALRNDLKLNPRRLINVTSTSHVLHRAANQVRTLHEDGGQHDDHLSMYTDGRRRTRAFFARSTCCDSFGGVGVRRIPTYAYTVVHEGHASDER